MPAYSRLYPYVAAVLVGGLASAVAVVLGPGPAPNPVSEPGEGEPEPVALDFYTRSMAKDAVIREVAAGRMSVPTAAALFGWMNTQPPTATPAGLAHITNNPVNAHLRAIAGSEADVLCLHVVAYVRAARAVSPDRLAEIEDEYRRACAAPGGSELPTIIELDCRDLLARAATVRVQRLTGPGDFRVSLDGLGLVEDR